MSLTFGLFTQVSGSGPLGPLVSPLKSSGKKLNLITKLVFGPEGNQHLIAKLSKTGSHIWAPDGEHPHLAWHQAMYCL